jgi:tetratricopeptide (TPR) repeat protein
MAWAARGATRAEAAFRPELALADFDRAVALAPASGQLRVFRGIGLTRLKRYDEALRELEVAATLDPLNGSLRGGGVALTALGARRYDQAAREAALAATRNPGFAGWRVIEAIAYVLGGDPARCAAMELHDPGRPIAAMCLRRLGRVTEADALIDSLQAAAETRQLSVYTLGFLGAYDAERDDVAGALGWLDRAFAISPTAFDFRFFDAGLFDRVRDDPAFAQGLERIRATVRERLDE